MTFRDIKADYSLHLLDREKLTYSEVKVASVGIPRFENKIGQQPCNVIDITVEVDGKPMTYAFVDHLNKAYVGNLLVATDKRDIISDVKAIRSASERAIKDVDRHQRNLDLCTTLLSDLDTEERTKQETEKRFTNLEKSITGLNDLLTKISDRLNKGGTI